MKLLQLNAWSIRLSARFKEIIQTESPDVVTLQEVYESTADTGVFPSLSEVCDEIRFHHKYFSPVYGGSLMGQPVQYGIATISNLELSGGYTEFTNLAYKDDFVFETDDYNIRNFQHVVVHDQNGRPIHVINHHGYHVPGHKNGNDFTLKACRQIAEYAKQLDGPIIITGDFNLLPDSESLSVFSPDFRNLTREYDLQTTRTDLTHKAEPCDYIFVNDKIVVKDFYASNVVASDHQGLVLDFEVTA